MPQELFEEFGRFFLHKKRVSYFHRDRKKTNRKRKAVGRPGLPHGDRGPTSPRRPSQRSPGE